METVEGNPRETSDETLPDHPPDWPALISEVFGNFSE
jgi:hypothetical protein